LWDVLEHVSNPTKTLKRCHELLKKDGFLIVNYPDYNSWVSKLLGQKWPFYLSVHLYYFNQQTIAQILNKNGFEIIRIKPHFQSLDLGYILFRAKKYLGSILTPAQVLVRSIGLNNQKIPYWIGQTLVIARKKG
ncbi:MAG: methyltransferase domain-containing protein, partial [archaeon]|nr:methyltransferase domain-containing protein [archaeon]